MVCFCSSTVQIDGDVRNSDRIVKYAALCRMASTKTSLPANLQGLLKP